MSQAIRRSAALLALAALLAGCAGPGSYVVLLPSPDGSVGRVVVQGPRGEQVLTQARTGLALDGSKPAFEVSQEKLQTDFGAAMAARPPLPEQFLLYFESGGSELTAESKALLPVILAHARARQTVDMSVIGHTDTQGTAQANVPWRSSGRVPSPNNCGNLACKTRWSQWSRMANAICWWLRRTTRLSHATAGWKSHCADELRLIYPS